MTHSANLWYLNRTIKGYRMNTNQKISVKKRDEKSIIHWLRQNILGREFVIYRVSWL